VRGHDNQITIAGLGGLNNSLSEMIVLGLDGLELDTGLGRALLGTPRDLTPFALVLLMLVWGLGQHFRRKRKGVERLLHLQNRDLRPE
jgi:hypothetical protein